jgi:hypothetical protein
MPVVISQFAPLWPLGGAAANVWLVSVVVPHQPLASEPVQRQGIRYAVRPALVRSANLLWEAGSWRLLAEDKDYGGKDSYGAAFDGAHQTEYLRAARSPARVWVGSGACCEYEMKISAKVCPVSGAGARRGAAGLSNF